jgi:2-succinyl-5-enolpyruvyl-6-hydroxy-3-cyclohexene-1-carboxylate synthase
MSKVIVVESKCGSLNIDKSRQATNRSNLEQDKEQWQAIVDGDENNKIIPTLVSRLEKNFEYYGFLKKSDITFTEVQKLAKAYLSADPWLQINYCRDSTRQSIDECVQTATLKKYVNDTFENIANGKEVPFNGQIVSKRQAVGLNGKQVKSRSIDAVGKIDNFEVKIFQKYSRVSGSGQTHQTVETQNWLEEVAKIKNKKMLFVAQLDGEEAESHIGALRALINKFDNIFVGNSEQVIDWLNAKK